MRQVAGNRGLGDFESQFQELAVDPGSSPGGILGRHGSVRSRSSGVIFGRPERRRERKRQHQRNPARCQPTTVSGFTTTSTLAHCDHQRRRPIQNRRSHGLIWGRGFLRLRTPTCCRKATSSSPRSCRERKKAPNQERKARRNRIMGPSLHDAVDGKAGSCKRLILRSNGILRTHTGLNGGKSRSHQG